MRKPKPKTKPKAKPKTGRTSVAIEYKFAITTTPADVAKFVEFIRSRLNPSYDAAIKVTVG